MDAITAVVVETGVRGMSPDTITTIALAVLTVVGTLVGSFGGVWWGQVLEDKRRRRGEMRREVSAWVGGRLARQATTRRGTSICASSTTGR